MKNIRKISEFLSEICQFLVVKFSIYLNRRVFVMNRYNNIDSFCLDKYDIRRYCVMFDHFSLGENLHGKIRKEISVCHLLNLPRE